MKNNKNKARERKKSSYAYNQIYSGFGYNKKGLASLEILVTTFFVIGLLFLLGALAINNTLKQEELAIAQKDTLNVKNIFSLLNKSLDSTWSLSSVQALYEASESGFEPTVIGNNQILSEFDYGTKAYWYRFHPEKEYTGIKLPSGSGISGVPNRCNNGNPGICLPQAANVENAMRITMEKIWFNLGNKAPYTILDRPVKITIPAKQSSDANNYPLSEDSQNSQQAGGENTYPALQDSQNKKCIAYCEPSLCSPGREKHKQGNELCGKDICCAEKYDWAKMIYTSYTKTEMPCFAGKGVCAKNCALGRERVAEYNTDCSSQNSFCCVPVLPENLAKVSELGTEVSVPLLYKVTKNDPDGVLGYLTIGVSKDYS